MRARSASTTELRPVTISLSSELFGRPGRLPWLAPALPPGAAAGLPPCLARAASSRSWAALRLPATCQVRSVAFGVGPLPSRARRLCPPVPTDGPFFLGLPAPGRPGLAIEAPLGSGRRVIEGDPRRCQLVA